MLGKRPALLIVDLVRAYLDPASPLYTGSERLIDNVCDVLESFRTHGFPIIFTQVRHSPLGIDGGMYYRKVPGLRLFAAGSELGEFTDRLRPGPGELTVSKQYASAFFGTSLASTLTATGIDTVVVVGASTSGCVRASAVDALQNGFVPVVVRDAVGDMDESAHLANLKDLDAKYAEVVDRCTISSWLARVRAMTKGAAASASDAPVVEPP